MGGWVGGWVGGWMGCLPLDVVVPGFVETGELARGDLGAGIGEEVGGVVGEDVGEEGEEGGVVHLVLKSREVAVWGEVGGWVGGWVGR